MEVQPQKPEVKVNKAALEQAQQSKQKAVATNKIVKKDGLNSTK